MIVKSGNEPKGVSGRSVVNSDSSPPFPHPGRAQQGSCEIKFLSSYFGGGRETSGMGKME